jgi:hypothetical protein
MTPEQFYSESKWPEMKDKFDKSAFLFHYYDLCQFANDYAQHYRNVIKLTTEDKERISIDAEEYVSNLFGTDADGAWRRNAAKDYIAGATAEHERLEKDQDYIDLKETIGSAQQELQAYKDIIKELLPLAEHEIKMSTCIGYSYDKWKSTISKARKLIDTVTPT